MHWTGDFRPSHSTSEQLLLTALNILFKSQGEILKSISSNIKFSNAKLTVIDSGEYLKGVVSDILIRQARNGESHLPPSTPPAHTAHQHHIVVSNQIVVSHMTYLGLNVHLSLERWMTKYFIMQ